MTGTPMDGDSLTPRQHVIAYPPPVRVWERTETGWASREWLPGEKAEYAREVLGQGGA